MLLNVVRYKQLNALERAAVDKFNEDAEKALKAMMFLLSQTLLL